MTTKVRSGVFETNSSSTHSLVLSPDMTNMVEPPLPDSILNEGVLHAFSGEFGWERETYYDVSSKLSYLYTDAMRQYETTDEEEKIDPNDPDVIESNEKLKLLVDAIKEYAGVDVVFHKEEGIYPFGYIDHQSHGECSGVWRDGVQGVIRFIFSSDSWFETSNDN